MALDRGASSAAVPVQNHGGTGTAPKRLGGVTGKGFLPGNRANPGGRPKGVAAFRQKVLKETKDGRVLLDYLLGALQSRSPRERIDAATLLLAYAYGKPVQPTELTGEEGGAITFRVVYEDRSLDDDR
jgi:hypothetical protein